MPTLTPYKIFVESGAQQGQSYPVTGSGITLGRSKQADVVLDDPLLSRVHCRFELRGAELWVIDLASANQTMVNQVAIEESRLTAGDRLEVGDTHLLVQAEVAGGAASQAGEVAIDLGFNQEPIKPEGRRNHLSPVLWVAAAIFALVAGTLWMLDPAGRQQQAESVRVPHEKMHSLLVAYEKIEADLANVFRYELNLTPAGLLSVSIDDLAAGKRHVRKEQQLEPELLAELTREIESSGFFTLERNYSGFAAREGELQEWRMTVALGPRVHTCHIVNRQEPEIFRALREKLETFSKNELGIWAIQFSGEKLQELAADALALGRQRYAEREVKYGNLFESIAALREALFYLDTVNPKPEFYGEIVDGLESSEAELERRYEEHRFQANRAINLKEWPGAAHELKILRELIPDKGDARHREATQKLLDVEARLKRGGR